MRKNKDVDDFLLNQERNLKQHPFTFTHVLFNNLADGDPDKYRENRYIESTCISTTRPTTYTACSLNSIHTRDN